MAFEPHEAVAVVSGAEAVKLLPFVLEDALEEVSGDADVERVAAIPGPQMRGTGGTRVAVGEQARVGRPALQPVRRPALQKTLALGHELAQGFGVVVGQRLAVNWPSQTTCTVSPSARSVFRRLRLCAGCDRQI